METEAENNGSSQQPDLDADGAYICRGKPDRADSAKTEAERQKCYTDAITHYTEVIDLDPELTEAYSNRGNAY